MAVVIEKPKSGVFKFKIGEKGKEFTLPKFSKFPINRALAQAEMTPEQVSIDYMRYILDECPGLEPLVDVPTLTVIIAEWQKDSGIEAGE